MFKKIKILLLCFFIFISNNLYAVENKILFKINNEIITTIDIFNEIKYLKLINSNLQNLSQKNLYEVAKNSLIRENIKKIELLKNNISLTFEESTVDKIKQNFANQLEINSIEELEIIFKKLELNENDITEKLIIENVWNSFIVKKFINEVKIDEEKIKKEISKKNYQNEYNLSEIVFELDNNENVNTKYNSIKNKIEEESFEDVATMVSISETSKTGGKLGWIKESSLSKKIKNELDIIKPQDITRPLVIPGGILILKINKIRKIKKEVNIKNEMQSIIRNKTNEQLNQFSILYFNKIKKNVLINEL